MQQRYVGVTSGDCEAADSLIQYAAERSDLIRYPHVQTQGWQIGSGPTEAKCKTTTHRVKGRGRRWDRENLEGMMALAALHDSNLWDNGINNRHRIWPDTN